MTRYLRTERWRFEPPACPVCGSRPEVEWVNVGTAAHAEPPWSIPTTLTCPNAPHDQESA